MDPNATLATWRNAALRRDIEAADEAAENLSEWLARGGFEPSWNVATRASFVEYCAAARIHTWVVR